MKITLKSATLINFKKIKFLEIAFTFLTNIFGANETGKTTIFDAIVWTLFGKNSQDSKDFNIKTLDSNNNPLPKLDHEVTVILEVDGMLNTFRRVYKEKWVKKRGEAETEFAGHETTFFWNDVSFSQSEYQAKIDSILKESTFKMITSPTYFNNMKWQDRRSVLFEIAGNITNMDIASDKPEFERLLSVIGNMDMVEYKKGITSRKKKLKEELESIPTRIDEINRNMPKVEDWEAIGTELTMKRFELTEIERQLTDISEAYRIANQKQLDNQNQISSLKREILKIESDTLLNQDKGKNDRERNISNLKRSIEDKQKDIEKLNASITENKTQIEHLAIDREKLLTSWHSENSKQLEFGDNAFNCPTCNRPFESDDVEAKQIEMLASFNTNKKKALDDISVKGQKVKSAIDQLIGENETHLKVIDSTNEEIAVLEHRLNEFEKADVILITPEVYFNKNEEYQKLKVQLTSLESKNVEVPKIDNAELIQKKTNINNVITELNRQLSLKSVIDQNNVRIKELEGQEKNLAQQIADMEKIEFTIESFTKAKIEAVEERINSKFRYAKFKMYELQINGGETETCETLYKGVPYSDLNTAGRILVGIDIINTLSKYYDVYCPVFLDNRESTTEIPEMECQIINLYVSPEDKTLRIA